jgi:hypothetical protein
MRCPITYIPQPLAYRLDPRYCLTMARVLDPNPVPKPFQRTKRLYCRSNRIPSLRRDVLSPSFMSQMNV